MIQWCVKGISLPGDAEARHIIDARDGIVCNWWRDAGLISNREIWEKLTPANIDMHVNQFNHPDPATGRPFCEVTPFISLTAGTMERDIVMATNMAHRAQRTALYFGSRFYREPVAYLYVCWLVVAPRRSVAVQGVAEEVRDINIYHRYSPFQTEGEIAAKIVVPANQIKQAERWEKDPAGIFRRGRVFPNPAFTRPETLSNIRELI
jgi:hypothetical protein